MMEDAHEQPGLAVKHRYRNAAGSTSGGSGRFPVISLAACVHLLGTGGAAHHNRGALAGCGFVGPSQAWGDPRCPLASEIDLLRPRTRRTSSSIYGFHASAEKNPGKSDEESAGNVASDLEKCLADRSSFTQLSGHMTFPGKHKWLGGAVDIDNDGSIYGIPSHATQVICLSPPVGENRVGQPDEEYQVWTIPLPPSVAKGKFKWLRGIICGGYLYGIPAWARAGVLRVDIGRLQRQRGNSDGRHQSRGGNDAISILPLPGTISSRNDSVEAFGEQTMPDENEPSRWLWHGAALNANKTAIYCIPSNALSVLKIDLASSKTSLLPIPISSTSLTETNKWYGGLLGDDNAIYGIPYAAAGVLRIDANTDAVSVLGSFGSRGYNWHGGVKSPENGAIYAFPAHSPFVLKVDTTGTSAGGMLSMIPIRRAPYDDDEVTRYKWLGGALGLDGAVYGMPSDASSVLRIDPSTDSASTFGVVSGEKNKWQGGVLGRDGFLYAIPSNAKNVLRVDTRPESHRAGGDGREKAMLVGDFPPKKDKWQGGFVARNGVIYGIPENFDRILKLTPPLRDDVEHGRGKVVVGFL